MGGSAKQLTRQLSKPYNKSGYRSNEQDECEELTKLSA